MKIVLQRNGQWPPDVRIENLKSLPIRMSECPEALNDGTLLNHDEQAIYSTVYVYEHTGLLPGYQSIAHYLKDINTVVILFVNTSGGNSWMKMETIYNRIVQILRRRSLKQ